MHGLLWTPTETKRRTTNEEKAGLQSKLLLMRHTGQPHHNTGNNGGWLTAGAKHPQKPCMVYYGQGREADNKWRKSWMHSKLLPMRHMGQPHHNTGNNGGWLTAGAKHPQKPCIVYYGQGREADNKLTKSWMHSKLLPMRHMGQPHHNTGNNGGWLTVGA